jgi:hypothetical protein
MRGTMAMAMLVAALPAGAARTAAADPVLIDPGRPGPYVTVTGEYALAPVRLPGLAKPVEMRAVVVAPAAPAGRRPLVLFLHGRHGTCRYARSETMDWPCPRGATEIPSYRGFRYAQRLLASQGYVTVSISANGVNGQDADLDDSGAAARSALVRRHLARWAGWSGAHRRAAPAVVRAVSPADLSRVLLVGHSRGGEGVDQAATDSVSPGPGAAPAPWTIRGVVLIGPTGYNENPAPDVPSLTLLPGCDGDVSNLAGQMYVDATRGISRGAALHSAIYVAGANHNFFSTAWTADDFSARGNRICSPGAPTRLTRVRQRAVARTYIAAAARLFVAGDDRIRPLLDGSGAAVPSAGHAVLLAEALGAGRTPLFVPARSDVVRGARLCLEVTRDRSAACLDPRRSVRCPHFVPLDPATVDPDRLAVSLRWSAAGRAVSLRPGRTVSVAGDSAVALRIIVPPNTGATRFGVMVADRYGRRALLGEITVNGLPATAAMAAYWGQEARVPLAPAGGLDLAHLSELRLVPRTMSGQAWLLDAWGWRPGTPAPLPVALPRVDIGAATVRPGTRTVMIPVTGRGRGTVRLFVAGRTTTSRLVTLPPGQTAIAVPLSRSAGRRQILAAAVRGAVVGSSRISVTVAVPRIRPPLYPSGRV